MRNNLYKIATAAFVLAIALTLGCEEKSGSKSSSSADKGLSSAEVEAVAPPPKEKVTSCKEGEKVKLLESINNDICGKMRFEYDNQNRLVKIYGKFVSGDICNDKTTTITYNNDDLITVGETKYVIKGNTITSESGTFTINKDGYIVPNSPLTYQYENGNLISMKVDDDNNSYTYDYTYDNKKSPFSNSNTPKWIIQDVLETSDASKNNVLKFRFWNPEQGARDVDSKYEYDSDGFPIKETEEGEEGESYAGYTTTTSYTYRTADCKWGAK